jgi:hypothetical protein
MDPDLLAALADALVLIRIVFAPTELFLERPIFGALTIGPRISSRV